MRPESAVRYVRSPDAVIKQVGTGAAVYVRERRALHVPNATARLLLELLVEPASLDELAAALVHATGAAEATVRNDLEECLAELVGHGILETRG